MFYGRVSTQQEAQLLALENQMRWYDEAARAHPDWQVVGRYVDEGVTGTSIKARPAFCQMLQDAQRQKFDLIVTREVCRFARNTVDTLTVTRKLASCGVEVFFVQDGIWTFQGDGELRLAIMATLAQEESRKISQRVRAGQKICQQNKTIFGNGNLLGYRLENKTYLVDPMQAKTVRTIFSLYAKGHSQREIARILQSKGYQTAMGKTVWSAAQVSAVLRNAVYTGKLGYHKSWVTSYLDHKRIHNTEEESIVWLPGGFEPIVSQTLYDKCALLRRQKSSSAANGVKGRRVTEDMWAKKLRCGCGAAMSRSVKNKNYASYSCNKRCGGTAPVEWKLWLMTMAVYEWLQTAQSLPALSRSGSGELLGRIVKENVWQITVEDKQNYTWQLVCQAGKKGSALRDRLPAQLHLTLLDAERFFEIWPGTVRFLPGRWYDVTLYLSAAPNEG